MDHVKLTLRVLGTCQVMQGQQSIHFKTKKSQALLIFLLTEEFLHPGLRHTRSRIAELLWPGIAERSALENLRQCLYRLRSVLPDTDDQTSFIGADRQHIWVSATADWSIDLEEMPAEPSPFLAYFYLPQNTAFEDWISEKREQIAALANGTTAETAVKARPASVLPLQWLAPALLLLGLPWLINNWQSGREQASVRPNTLAVLPFETVGADSMPDYLRQGITDDLITALMRSGDWRIISRASSNQYASSELDDQSIGAELGVRYLLRGTLRRGGDRLQLNLSLIDAQRGQRIWGNRYREDISAIAALRATWIDEIARRIRSVSDTLNGVPTHTPDPQAYAYYLKARTAFYEASPNAIGEALQYYRKALEIDPGYPEAHLQTAITLTVLCSWWGNAQLQMDSIYPTVMRHLEMAREQPDLVGEAWRVEGFVRLWAHDLEKAERCMDRAIARHIDTECALSGLAYVNMLQQETDRALQYIYQAQSLNPYLGYNHQVEAEIHAVRGDYRAARSALRRGLEFSPNKLDLLVRLSWIDLIEGHTVAAVSRLDSLYGQRPAVPYYLTGYLTAALILDQQTERAQQLIDLMEQGHARGERGYAYYLALARHLQGEPKMAENWANLSREAKEPDAYWLGLDPLFHR